MFELFKNLINVLSMLKLALFLIEPIYIYIRALVFCLDLYSCSCFLFHLFSNTFSLFLHGDLPLFLLFIIIKTRNTKPRWKTRWIQVATAIPHAFVQLKIEKQSKMNDLLRWKQYDQVYDLHFKSLSTMVGRIWNNFYDNNSRRHQEVGCSDAALTLLWCCSDAALTMLWCCTNAALTLESIFRFALSD